MENATHEGHDASIQGRAAREFDRPMTDAYRFFRSLEQHLNEALPRPREVATSIAEIVRTSKTSRTDLHKSFPEGALLNHYLLPAIHSFLSQLDGMDLDGARQSLLSESYREMREYASGTPARLSRHPFEKVIGASAQSVIRRWKSANPTGPRVTCTMSLSNGVRREVLLARRNYSGRNRARYEYLPSLLLSRLG